MTTTQHYLTTHPPGECAICRRCSAPLTWAREELLQSIEQHNKAGVLPTIAKLTRGLPARTRANRATMIGELIHAGLLVNAANPGAGAYSLRITRNGTDTAAASS